MSRIVPAVALIAVVAAGCGGAARPQRSAVRGLPPALARGWEAQTSAIAAAATAGDGCTAVHLADSLRAQVVATEDRVPLRLRSPLVAGVTALADRITCAPPAAKKPPKPPQHGKPGHHGHGHGDGGDGNGQ